MERWGHVPRLSLRFGRELYPAWTTMGRIGALAGGLLFLGLGLRASAPVWLLLAIVTANLAGFYAWGWITTWWRDRRRYVLVEHALVAGGSTIGLATLAGFDVLTIADAWVASIALTMALGRVGCLFMGCCHGRAARRGLRYRWMPPWILGKQWDAVRVFPIQAVEAAGLGVLALAAVTLALTTYGWGALVTPAAYAVLRFELELWRGDARRYIGKLSHNQWSCLLVVALTLARPVVAASGLTMIAAIALAQRSRLGAPTWSLTSPADMAGIEAAIARALAGTATCVAGVRLEPDGYGSVRMIASGTGLDRDLATVVASVVDLSVRERPVSDRA